MSPEARELCPRGEVWAEQLGRGRGGWGQGVWARARETIFGNTGQLTLPDQFLDPGNKREVQTGKTKLQWPRCQQNQGSHHSEVRMAAILEGGRGTRKRLRLGGTLGWGAASGCRKHSQRPCGGCGWFLHNPSFSCTFVLNTLVSTPIS